MKPYGVAPRLGSVCLVRVACFLPVAFAALGDHTTCGAEPGSESAAKDDRGCFFAIKGAKDCAFDASRDRLYVTTPEKLVVADTKNRKILDSIALSGSLQACDVAPDFTFLAIAPIAAQFVYRVALKWDRIEDMEIAQVKFKASSSETGVFGLCVGCDNSVLFSTTFAGSGWVKLRCLSPANQVKEIGSVNMDTVLTAGGDRQYAAVAEGNISSGPLKVYDFRGQALRPVAELRCFFYEIGCARGARYFARPHAKGCDLYDAAGGRLGTIQGGPVICAAFHPVSNSLFLLRHGERSVQEYDINGSSTGNSYPLDKPLVIKGDVNVSDVAHLHAVGPRMVVGNVRTVVNVNYRTYRSGRLKVCEDGKLLFAVLPTGVYMFPVKAPAPSPAERGGKPKIKVIEASGGK